MPVDQKGRYWEIEKLDIHSNIYGRYSDVDFDADHIVAQPMVDSFDVTVKAMLRMRPGMEFDKERLQAHLSSSLKDFV